jgi:restriction endonuclease S subunit
MWETVKLGEIAKGVGGNGFPKKYQGNKNKDIPFFKVSDMNIDGNEKFMLKSNNFVDVNDLKEMKAKLHPAGTIIFPKIGGAISTNKKRILTKDAAFDNNVMGVVSSNKILPEYLYKVFLNIDLYELSNKAALPSINNGTVNDIDFVLPPLAEQERIVAKLDAAFAEIDESIKNINLKESKLDKFKSAIISDSYRGNGWDNERLGDCVSYEKNNAKGSSLPYVGMENIAPETMDLVGEVVIPEKTSSTFHFNKSHVLFGRLRPYLRKVLVPDFEGQCSTEIFCIKPIDKVIREFLAYWLLEQKISSKIEATSTGARMPRANMNALLEFDFPIPSTKEQKKIISKIDLIFTKISEAKNTLAKSKTNYFALKSAILSQELQPSEAA